MHHKNICDSVGDGAKDGRDERAGGESGRAGRAARLCGYRDLNVGPDLDPPRATRLCGAMRGDNRNLRPVI